MVLYVYIFVLDAMVEIINKYNNHEKHCYFFEHFPQNQTEINQAITINDTQIFHSDEFALCFIFCTYFLGGSTNEIGVNKNPGVFAGAGVLTHAKSSYFVRARIIFFRLQL